MGNVGIKISRPGYDVRTAAPNELSFSSAYKTLKIHTQGSGALLDGSRIATIPHNLGYVPVFFVHANYPVTLRGSGVTDDDMTLVPVGNNSGSLFAYADETNLYIKAQEDFGKLTYNISTVNEDLAYEYSGSGGGSDVGDWYVGNSSGFFDIVYGAWRFKNIQLEKDESVYSADLNMYILYGQDGPGEIKSNIWGIDEDNIGAFNGAGSNPTARAKTTAQTSHNFTVSSGQYAGADVTSQVNEIIARSGWASGNNMGFMVWDNGTADGRYVGEFSGSKLTTLTILKSETIANYKYTIFLNKLE